METDSAGSTVCLLRASTAKAPAPVKTQGRRLMGGTASTLLSADEALAQSDVVQSMTDLVQPLDEVAQALVRGTSPADKFVAAGAPGSARAPRTGVCVSVSVHPGRAMGALEVGAAPADGCAPQLPRRDGGRLPQHRRQRPGRRGALRRGHRDGPGQVL